MLLAGGSARAVSLPVRIYSELDGLPGNRVHRITRDSRGFLWFATDRGLARFDGSRFTVYGEADGLPGEGIDDIAETKDGALWIAGDDALYRLDPLACRVSPGGAPPFVRVSGAHGEYPSPETLEPVGERDIRVGTVDGVFETRGGSLVRAAPALPRRIWDDHAVLALARTASGEWTGTIDALWLTPAGGGDSRRFELRRKTGTDRISALLRDRRGRLWVGTWGGLFVLESGNSGGGDPFDPGRRLSDEPVTALLERPDGTILAAAKHALLEFPAAGSPRRTGAAELGALFEDVELRCLAEDPAGNLWIGTTGGGAIRIDREGFLRFGREDGLEASRTPALFARRDAPCAELVAAGRVLVACFDGRRFHTVRPQLPRPQVDAGWGSAQLALEDARGRLWLPTGEGLLRYPPRARLEDLAGTPPERVFARENGLAVDNIFRIFQARGGDLWISAVSPERNLLARWLADSDRVQAVPDSDGPPRTVAVTAIGEDAGGAVWIGTNGAGLWRRRLDRFERIDRDAVLSPYWITSIFRDREGRLWVGTDRAGLFRFDAPEAVVPTFQRMTSRNGLSSMGIGGFAEDRDSRIYALTSSGVDRFLPRGASVEHFTGADGLPGGRLAAILGDRTGSIWVAGEGGIATLNPVPPLPEAPVSLAFDDVEVAGERLPVPIGGLARLSTLRPAPGRDSLRFEVAALAWEPRRPVVLRYRLDEKSPWSDLPSDRTINLPRLAPGRYRVEVQGVDSGGVRSRRPAVAEFSIAAPLVRRPWFFALWALAAASAGFLFQRWRLEQRMRLERIRTQIAADLHDDVGAGLSEVAVLAEVVRQRVGPTDAQSATLVGEVAQTARDLVDSMGEIVWSIDPRRDDLGSLAARLRHFASTFAETRGIRFTMEAPEDLARVALASGPRRELYLLLKEAVHNAMRHAGAGSVALRMSLGRGTLRAEVVDDGRGFDPALPREGHGLDSMRQRAATLGAALELASAAGSGTRVTIAVPLGRPA